MEHSISAVLAGTYLGGTKYLISPPVFSLQNNLVSTDIRKPQYLLTGQQVLSCLCKLEVKYNAVDNSML